MSSTVEPRPRLVIVTDDDELFVESVTTLLAGISHLRVIGRAANGQEAVELTISLRPDVVLMDLDMPLLDGIEATRQIRRLQPRVCVIVVTGTEDPARIAAAKEAGAAGFVPKLRVPLELVDAVTTICDGFDDAVRMAS